MISIWRFNLSTLLFVLLLPALRVYAAEDVQIKVHPVANNIYMLEGSGGNIGVLAGEDGIIMVDDQFAPVSQKIRAALDELESGQVKFVLNTHWHPDHTGGNEEFGKTAAIIAHTNVRERLSKKQVRKFVNKTVEATGKTGLPVVTFKESVSLHFNNEQVDVLHFPAGHTDGDSIVFFTRADVVHMGDHFFNGFFPFVDLESGGSVEGLIRNVEIVLGMISEETRIIPGHGPLATKADLKAYHEMLTKTAAIVAERIAHEQTLDQAKTAALPGEWEKWGSGFIGTDRWIEIVYNSYKTGK